jgi:hypothetical protein
LYPNIERFAAQTHPAGVVCSVLTVFDQIAHVMEKSYITFAQINALDNGDVLAPFEILTFPHVVLFQGLENFRTYHGAFREAE